MILQALKNSFKNTFYNKILDVSSKNKRYITQLPLHQSVQWLGIICQIANDVLLFGNSYQLILKFYFQ